MSGPSKVYNDLTFLSLSEGWRGQEVKIKFKITPGARMKLELYCSYCFCFKSVQWIHSTISNIPAHLHFQPKHDEKTEKPITYFKDDTSNHHGKKKKKKKRSHSNGYFEVTCTLKSKWMCEVEIESKILQHFFTQSQYK